MKPMPGDPPVCEPCSADDVRDSRTPDHETVCEPCSADDAAGSASEDRRMQCRGLATVWLSAGSAVAAMVFASWYIVIRDGTAPHGDMLGHAATAEWLRILPWWDWRGWSDWFYGGQAIGVNYPPLGHAWIRFTHPHHGQMAAVALGLLVLLPWGTIRLARAIGYSPGAQRAAVAAVMVAVAASGQLFWVFSGFHSNNTFFGSWPAMLATVAGLFCAAWAARAHRPLACGAVAGIAVLINPTVMPGVGVVCIALLAGSGLSFRQGLRWVLTAGSASLAVCAWWLVPFADGRDRMVNWELSLSRMLSADDPVQMATLMLIGAAAAFAARCGRPSRRLAGAAAAALMAAAFADLLGYPRAERWLQLPVLIATIAAAGLSARRSEKDRAGCPEKRRTPPDHDRRRSGEAGHRSGCPGKGRTPPLRPAWTLLSVAALVVFTVSTVRFEPVAIVVWLLRGAPRSPRAWGAAFAWTAVLFWFPFAGVMGRTDPLEPLEASVRTAIRSDTGSATDTGGAIFLYPFRSTPAGNLIWCRWPDGYGITTGTDGRLRALVGMFKETSASAEFVIAHHLAMANLARPLRPAWHDSWQDADAPRMSGPAAAGALGAQWYAACDDDGEIEVVELSGVTAAGTAVAVHEDEVSWHRAAVRWWVGISAGTSVDGTLVPVLRNSAFDESAHPVIQAAAGVSVRSERDALVVTAEKPGWAWLRVPWDPYWRSESGSVVLKGGPGHLVVWIESGTNVLRWSVPGAVDVAAGVVTGAGLLAAMVSAALNHRRGFDSDSRRRRTAAEVFAGVDAHDV